jgi:outer membrane lipopolysaccharide assembly protein LptE/RlpB
MSSAMKKLDVHLNRITNPILALVVLAVVTGCGYHFKGMGLKAPEGVRTIAITMLENRTSESGIETVFTGDLSYEFTRSKILRVVDKNAADAVLSGKVSSLSVDTISHTASYASDERRAVITLDLSLRRADGNVIWADSALSDNEAFKVDASNKFATERNRRVAIEAISKRVAEKIHNRILLDF